MFTSLVSWLLVACVPGLLMLAALGLGRLERDLTRKAVTPTDVDQFLAHAESVDMHTLAREGMPEALELLHRREAQRLSEWLSTGPHSGPRHAAPMFSPDLYGRHAAAIPAPAQARRSANPQFEAPRHVNRV